MVLRPIRGVRSPHVSQRSGDRMTTTRQQRPNEEDEHLVIGRSGKRWLKMRKDSYNGCWKEHRISVLMIAR